MISPSQKRLPVILATGARDNYSRPFESHITILVHNDINVHFSCLFITSSRIRSFIIVHLTFVSVFYHKEMVCISLFSSFDFILRHLGSIMFTLQTMIAQDRN